MQSNSDKQAKSLDAQLNELNAKLDAAQREITDITSARDRAQSEATDFGRKLEEAESALSTATKSDAANKKALAEARTSLDDESRMRAKLQGDSRNMQAELDTLRDQLEVRAPPSTTLHTHTHTHAVKMPVYLRVFSVFRRNRGSVRVCIRKSTE